MLCELTLAADAAGDVALSRELAEEAVAMAERHRLDWYRARAALLSASVHLGTPLGDQRLGEALELTERLALGILWRRRERPRAAALLARALRADLPGAATAARLAAECGREVLHECVDRLADARRRASGSPTRWATTPTWTPRRCGCSWPTRTPAWPRPPSACAGCSRAAPARRSGSRPSAACGCTAPAPGCRTPPSGAPRRARCSAPWCAPTRAGCTATACSSTSGRSCRPERGTRALDTTLHELRRTLEPLAPPRSGGSLIDREGEIYRLALGERDSWDAGEFLRLARAAPGAADEVALERMLRAETLWRGDFLPDFPYEPWGEDARRELERARIALLERLARTLAEMGRPAAAIDRYRHLVEPDREREGWHRALMRAYAQAGERPLALRQFHACRATLRSRLGIEPSAETRELYASLL